MQADRHADDHDQRRRDERDLERDAAAVDRAAEHVAPELVDAERMPGRAGRAAGRSRRAGRRSSSAGPASRRSSRSAARRSPRTRSGPRSRARPSPPCRGAGAARTAAAANGRRSPARNRRPRRSTPPRTRSGARCHRRSRRGAFHVVPLGDDLLPLPSPDPVPGPQDCTPTPGVGPMYPPLIGANVHERSSATPPRPLGAGPPRCRFGMAAAYPPSPAAGPRSSMDRARAS